jgi:hypothetical protein
LHNKGVLILQPSPYIMAEIFPRRLALVGHVLRIARKINTNVKKKTAYGRPGCEYGIAWGRMGSVASSFENSNESFVSQKMRGIL